jgi:hypothetical protein
MMKAPFTPWRFRKLRLTRRQPCLIQALPFGGGFRYRSTVGLAHGRWG